MINGLRCKCRFISSGDKHGERVLLKRPKMILAYVKGTDQKYADEAYYENQDKNKGKQIAKKCT